VDAGANSMQWLIAFVGVSCAEPVEVAPTNMTNPAINALSRVDSSF